MKDRGRDSVAWRYRSHLRLLTLLNHKTPKGESAGYMSAILYLAPHTSGGGRSLCPYSTHACRMMCLGETGLASLPRQIGARLSRTDLFHNARAVFMDGLALDLEKFVAICQREALKPAVRLNGSSDVIWEREAPDLFNRWHQVAWYDYSKIPLEHRVRRPDYHLTYSVGAAEDWPRALAYAAAGHSVAVVVPEELKAQLAGQEVDIGPCAVPLVDGDEHDLRFLDAPGSIVLLKPKGHVRTSLVRTDPLGEIRRVLREQAA